MVSCTTVSEWRALYTFAYLVTAEMNYIDRPDPAMSHHPSLVHRCTNPAPRFPGDQQYIRCQNLIRKVAVRHIARVDFDWRHLSECW